MKNYIGQIVTVTCELPDNTNSSISICVWPLRNSGSGQDRVGGEDVER